jgi:hypothetical protein
MKSIESEESRLKLEGTHSGDINIYIAILSKNKPERI